MLEELSDRQLDLLIRFHIGKPSFRRDPPPEPRVKREDPYIRAARSIMKRMCVGRR